MAFWAYCAHLLTPDYRERQQWKKDEKKEKSFKTGHCKPNKKTGVKRQWRKAEYVRYRPEKRKNELFKAEGSPSDA